jgi:hypothetical protein
VLTNVGDFRSAAARRLLLGDNNALTLEEKVLSFRILYDREGNNKRIGIWCFFRRVNQVWKVAQNLLRALDLLNLLLTENFPMVLNQSKSRVSLVSSVLKRSRRLLPGSLVTNVRSVDICGC